MIIHEFLCGAERFRRSHAQDSCQFYNLLPGNLVHVEAALNPLDVVPVGVLAWKQNFAHAFNRRTVFNSANEILNLGKEWFKRAKCLDP